MQWIILSGSGFVLFALLWRFGLPKYRRITGPWALGCGALCAALLIGPPVDAIAGAIVMLGLLGVVAWAWFST